MIRFLGFAILALIIIGLVPLIIQLFAAFAVLFVGLALLAAGCSLVVRLVRAFTAPKIEQARERPRVKERHQEGQNRRQTQERHQKNSRRQEADCPQDQGRHQENSRRQQKKQQWRTGQQESKHTTSGSYYKMLGVEPNATREEIDKAWRRIDSGQYLAIETRRAYFEAYNVLSNPDTRQKYDAKLQKRRREKEQRWHQEQEQKRRQEQEQKHRQEQEQKRYRSAGHQESYPFTGTYYERLYIEPDATQIEIKKAWRTFAQNWHPDVCKKADEKVARVVFQSGNEAYRVLSAPEIRRNYDSLLLSERREQEERRRRERRRQRYTTEREQQGQHKHSSKGKQEGGRRRASQNSQQHAKNRSAQNHNHRQHQRTRYNTHQGRRRQSTQNGQQNRSQHASQRDSRHFTGTWARIKLGPWTGMWGAWIESLNVSEGDVAYVRRRDGHVCKVVVIEILNHSYGKRVTLCRVHSPGTL